MKQKIAYGKLPTEQINSRSRNIGAAGIDRTLRIIQQEDLAVPRAVQKCRKEIAAGASLITRALRAKGRLFFTGAGTSGRLAVLEAAECPPTFNTPPGMVQAVMAGGKASVFRSREGAEDRKDMALSLFRAKLRPGDVLVGIAASGVTPFVAGALQAAREKKCAAILVTCNPDPAFKKIADCVIAPRTGPEVITGSTRLKAGTATKLVLNQLTVCSMIQLGKVYHNRMVDLQPRSKKLEARALRLIQELGKVSPRKAEFLLGASHNNAKTAILMARKDCSYQQAKILLKKYQGSLAKALQK